MRSLIARSTNRNTLGFNQVRFFVAGSVSMRGSECARHSFSGHLHAAITAGPAARKREMKSGGCSVVARVVQAVDAVVDYLLPQTFTPALLWQAAPLPPRAFMTRTEVL
jgi:hypothetical protein